MTLAKFKHFFQKNFRDFKAFVDSIWKKIKRNSQYQDKLVLHWTASFKYLQSILVKFNLKSALEEGIMMQYFWKGFWPLIRVNIEQRGQELNSFKK